MNVCVFHLRMVGCFRQGCSALICGCFSNILWSQELSSGKAYHSLPNMAEIEETLLWVFRKFSNMSQSWEGFHWSNTLTVLFRSGVQKLLAIILIVDRAALNTIFSDKFRCCHSIDLNLIRGKRRTFQLKKKVIWVLSSSSSRNFWKPTLSALSWDLLAFCKPTLHKTSSTTISHMMAYR